MDDVVEIEVEVIVVKVIVVEVIVVEVIVVEIIVVEVIVVEVEGDVVDCDASRRPGRLVVSGGIGIVRTSPSRRWRGSWAVRGGAGSG
jgi:hypothetical protein